MGRLGLISVTGPQGGVGPNFKKIKQRVKSPLTGGGGSLVARVMRKGDGSINDQFNSQATFPSGGGRVPWTRTKPFGSRPAPSRTLVRTGGLKAAWTGTGAGAVLRRSPRRLTVGVDKMMFPQAGRLNSKTQSFTKARRIGKQGKSKMHWLLGMKFGVWISDRKLRRRGLRVPSRRVAINPRMMKRVRAVITEWVIHGTAQGTRGI